MKAFHLIDLSHIIEAGMTTYKGLPGPIITECGCLDVVGKRWFEILLY